MPKSVPRLVLALCMCVCVCVKEREREKESLFGDELGTFALV